MFKLKLIRIHRMYICMYNYIITVIKLIPFQECVSMDAQTRDTTNSVLFYVPNSAYLN